MKASISEYLLAPSLDLKNQIVKENIALVKSIVSKYSGDFDDLTQTGLIALCESLDKFDPSKGSFSNFATRVIHSRLINYIERKQPLIKHPKGKKYEMHLFESQTASHDYKPEKLEEVLNTLTSKEKKTFFTHLSNSKKPGWREAEVLKKVKKLYFSIDIP